MIIRPGNRRRISNFYHHEAADRLCPASVPCPLPNNTYLTEIELIKACIQEDAAAQKALFVHYSNRMYGVCLRYARNQADAEDILQEAFIKVFGKLGQFKFEGSFEGWIRKIVVNTALKKYTLQRYEKELTGYEWKEKDEGSSDPAAYGNITQKELLELINQLPDGYRMVFNLYVIEGYQHEEIAELLGIQPGTSRSQLVKARAMLQKQLMASQKLTI